MRDIIREYGDKELHRYGEFTTLIKQRTFSEACDNAFAIGRSVRTEKAKKDAAERQAKEFLIEKRQEQEVEGDGSIATVDKGDINYCSPEGSG